MSFWNWHGECVCVAWKCCLSRKLTRFINRVMLSQTSTVFCKLHFTFLRGCLRVCREEPRLLRGIFMEYLPVDPVLSQTSKGRTSCCAARGFENEVQTALQRVLRIRPPHTQQAKREQPWKTPPITPGMLQFTWHADSHISKHVNKLSPQSYFYTLFCSHSCEFAHIFVETDLHAIFL